MVSGLATATDLQAAARGFLGRRLVCAAMVTREARVLALQEAVEEPAQGELAGAAAVRVLVAAREARGRAEAEASREAATQRGAEAHERSKQGKAKVEEAAKEKAGKAHETLRQTTDAAAEKAGAAKDAAWETTAAAKDKAAAAKDAAWETAEAAGNKAQQSKEAAKGKAAEKTASAVNSGKESAMALVEAAARTAALAGEVAMTPATLQRSQRTAARKAAAPMEEAARPVACDVQNEKAKGMVEKLQETRRELEPLQSRKTDMEAKVGSLEVALLAAIAGSSELESVVNEMKMEMPAARKEGENQRIEQILERLARLEKLVSLLIMRTEEMPSCTKQGMASSEQISNTKELKAAKTILGNLVNLAHPDKGTSLANWILRFRSIQTCYGYIK